MITINKNIFNERFEDIKKNDFCLMKTEKNYYVRLRKIFIFFIIVFWLFWLLPEIYSFLINIDSYNKDILHIIIVFFVIFSTTFLLFIILLLIDTTWLYLSNNYLVNKKKKKIIKIDNIISIKFITIDKSSVNNRYNYDYFIETLEKDKTIVKHKISLHEYLVIKNIFTSKFVNIKLLWDIPKWEPINKDMFYKDWTWIFN